MYKKTRIWKEKRYTKDDAYKRGYNTHQELRGLGGHLCRQDAPHRWNQTKHDLGSPLTTPHWFRAWASGAASYCPLKRATAAVAIFDYFNTRLGITAGDFIDEALLALERMSPPLGPFLIQSIDSAQNSPRFRWCWCRPGLYPIMVQGPPCLPPLHRHRKKTMCLCAGTSGTPIWAGW